MSPDRLAAGDDTAGCYVHLPFCDRICPYCDFAVVRHVRERVERYMSALAREIDTSSRPRKPVRTIFLGGGTPSALDAGTLERLLAALFKRFDIEPGSIECSLEANPSRNIDDLPKWKGAGVTRLSIGIQSLDDGDLHKLGREHSAAQAEAFVRAAHTARFASVSIDLIAGVPGQSPDSFARTLERAISLEPDHVSVYGLTIEPSTPYASWHAREPDAFPDDDAVAEILSTTHVLLPSAGYEHYELSNFARPGHRCRHNIGYWRQRDCIAYGMSAAGYEDGERYRNERDFDAYCKAIEAGASPCAEVERLDFKRRIGEAAMLALRTAEGIGDADFKRRFDIDVTIAFAAARKKCSDAGLLEVDGHGARLTAKGRLLANDVCAEFLIPQIDEPSEQPSKGAPIA
ncbi:MAG TPA: radical SAM family heme chaperone HemW [Candidatus Eremiobacteraceae bacterium]|nr:radical SAM family heme chaperone HemW [Candidatus Eremiobacteraceae bacterium]